MIRAIDLASQRTVLAGDSSQAGRSGDVRQHASRTVGTADREVLARLGLVGPREADEHGADELARFALMPVAPSADRVHAPTVVRRLM